MEEASNRDHSSSLKTRTGQSYKDFQNSFHAMQEKILISNLFKILISNQQSKMFHRQMGKWIDKLAQSISFPLPCFTSEVLIILITNKQTNKQEYVSTRLGDRETLWQQKSMKLSLLKCLPISLGSTCCSAACCMLHKSLINRAGFWISSAEIIPFLFNKIFSSTPIKYFSDFLKQITKYKFALKMYCYKAKYYFEVQSKMFHHKPVKTEHPLFQM